MAASWAECDVRRPVPNVWLNAPALPWTGGASCSGLHEVDPKLLGSWFGLLKGRSDGTCLTCYAVGAVPAVLRAYSGFSRDVRPSWPASAQFGCDLAEELPSSAIVRHVQVICL